MNIQVETLAHRIRSPIRVSHQPSLNSIDYDDFKGFKKKLNAILEDETLKIPVVPTRDSLSKVFKHLNLDVKPVRVLECLIAVRGPEMEQASEASFSMDKLVSWIWKHIRSFKHLDDKKADSSWVKANETATGFCTQSLPPAPWKPEPTAYMRKGTGSGGGYINRLLYQRNKSPYIRQEQTQTNVFSEYGLNAKTAASSYDYQSRKEKRKRLVMKRNLDSRMNMPEVDSQAVYTQV